MAKRRRVGNLLALGVLGALVGADLHPYEIAARMRERGKDEQLAVKWGSLYTVMANLAKHGLVEAVASERDGARPERTVYHLTDDGVGEMLDWVRELVREVEPERPRLVAGLSMLVALPPDEAVELLRARIAALGALLERGRARLAQARQEVARIHLVEDEYSLATLALEADWVQSLVDDIVRGTFEGLAEWREMHERGGLMPG